MAYHTKTKQLVRRASQGQGSKLGKLAVAKGLSVNQIALITGASRSTVYSWFSGKGVTNAYRPIVQVLINRLRTGTKEQIMELQQAKAQIPPLLLI